MLNFKFKKETYTTLSDVENAVDRYAEETFDDFLDDNWGEIDVCGLTYRPSVILKNTDPIAYRCSIADYSSYLFEEVEEVEIDEE